MTTVSASSAAAQPISQPRVEKAGGPKQRLLDQISAQQQAGSLSDTDASALTSAVQDIDQAISGTSGTRGGTRLDPAQARSRMDDLIGAEVTKGALTSDQATTLKSLLSSQKGGGRDGDRGGVGGAGGPPPGPPPSGGADAAGSTDTASATTDASDLLASFLKQVQDSQAQTQASGYGASGSGSTTKGSQAAVFDFRV
ncbi:hypothetical protein LRS73_24970 [Methylobacterium currus]|uniref:hypothetical protein n=1 Tax=Methylobacterium currus TaxID=2051553 RepID=UPI001E430B26|nr:hypothetical protein [Methylobacterium currus]UHC15717.1 hypothetical protein LRS73_24970 [Methylobacterium currus]